MEEFRCDNYALFSFTLYLLGCFLHASPNIKWKLIPEGGVFATSIETCLRAFPDGLWVLTERNPIIKRVNCEIRMNLELAGISALHRTDNRLSAFHNRVFPDRAALYGLSGYRDVSSRSKNAYCASWPEPRHINPLNFGPPRAGLRRIQQRPVLL